MDPTAILISSHRVVGMLAALIERLGESGLPIVTVPDISTAVESSAGTTSQPCILIDLRDLTTGAAGDVKLASEAIHRVIDALPPVAPIVLLVEPDPALIIACFRAGAGDVLDLELENAASIQTTITRIFHRQAEREIALKTVTSLREMIEDLVKDLIRTERRSIDLEDKLNRAQTSRPLPVADLRQPAILLVESDREVADELADRLETAGIATYAYVSGEESVREAKDLAAGEAGLDLALVAVELPGINGLETVRRLRELVPGLPAFLVTSVHDADLAAEAADLGVVGFVHKPLDDMDEVVGRLAQLAQEFLQRTREHLYIQRIKERHERILARYRSLPREA
jgi:CheY-like chemotaxis protein